MKECTKCKILTDNFSFDKRRSDGLLSQCRDCMRKHQSQRNKTKAGLISKIYSSQKAKSLKRGHDLPMYSLKELKLWFSSQEHFDSLYYNWVESGYKKDFIPSVDRIDSTRGYSFENIQLVTWGENNKNNYANPISSGNSKRVIKLDENDVFIERYDSITKAAELNCLDRKKISRACLGYGRSYGGYRWMHE